MNKNGVGEALDTTNHYSLPIMQIVGPGTGYYVIPNAELHLTVHRCEQTWSGETRVSITLTNIVRTVTYFPVRMGIELFQVNELQWYAWILL